MSLHWILALTLTLTLTHCLPIDHDVVDAFTSIKTLSATNCTEANSTFYSPSGSECIIQALNCVKEELKTVTVECFPNVSSLNDTNIKGYQAVNRLNQAITEMLKEKKENCPTNWSCERESRSSYHDFLKNVETLIQKLKSTV